MTTWAEGRAAADRVLDRPTADPARLHELAPGRTHLCACGTDEYPEGMVSVLWRGYGVRVEDLGGT